MSKVLALYHIVFATSGRCPALHDVNRLDLHRVICSIVEEKKCRMFCINSVTDHLHMLIHLSPNISLSNLMAAVKANSSTWMKQDARTVVFRLLRMYCFSKYDAKDDFLYRIADRTSPNSVFRHRNQDNVPTSGPDISSR